MPISKVRRTSNFIWPTLCQPQLLEFFVTDVALFIKFKRRIQDDPPAVVNRFLTDQWFWIWIVYMCRAYHGTRLLNNFCYFYWFCFPVTGSPNSNSDIGDALRECLVWGQTGMRHGRHRPLDFWGSRRHQKLLRCLLRHYVTLIQTP